MVQGSKAKKAYEVGILTTLPVPRSSIHQAVTTVTNALLLKLDFKVGICKSTYTSLLLIFPA